MKKTIAVLGVAMAVLFLAGCNKKTAQNENNKVIQNEEAKEGGSVISSIKEAMNLGKKMKCVYSTEINGQSLQTESFIDGKNHKAITTINGEKNYSVMDGDMFYAWSEKDKKGTKMSMKCIEDLKTQTEENPQVSSAIGDVKASPEDFEDAMNVKCEPISSIDLTVPSDVEFTDSCEIMKNSLEMMKQYKNQIPAQIPAAESPVL